MPTNSLIAGNVGAKVVKYFPESGYWHEFIELIEEVKPSVALAEMRRKQKHDKIKASARATAIEDRKYPVIDPSGGPGNLFDFV